MRWITNCFKQDEMEYKRDLTADNGIIVVDRPKATTDLSTVELEVMGVIGLYALDGEAP